MVHVQYYIYWSYIYPHCGSYIVSSGNLYIIYGLSNQWVHVDSIVVGITIVERGSKFHHKLALHKSAMVTQEDFYQLRQQMPIDKLFCLLIREAFKLVQDNKRIKVLPATTETLSLIQAHGKRGLKLMVVGGVPMVQ